jgi:hypothetical protein
MITPFEWALAGALGTFIAAAGGKDTQDVYEVLYDAYYDYVHNASTDPIPPAWEDDVIYHDMMYMLQAFCRLCIESSDFEIAITVLAFASFVYIVNMCAKTKYPAVGYVVGYVVLVGVFNHTCVDFGWVFPLTAASAVLILRCWIKWRHTRCKLQELFQTFHQQCHHEPVSICCWFAVIKETNDLIRLIDHNQPIVNALSQEIGKMHSLVTRVDQKHGLQWAGQHYNGVYWDREFQYLTSLITPAAPAAIPPAAPAAIPAAPAAIPDALAASPAQIAEDFRIATALAARTGRTVRFREGGNA